jgi:hypothetical protein
VPTSQLGNVASVTAVSNATSNIATLQGQMMTANTDITTLQGQTTNLQQIATLAATNALLCTNGTQISKSLGTHTTVASIDTDISSLQASRTTDEANISTLQGQMTTANTNIGNNTTAIAAINSSKGAASGIATLDTSSYVPAAQLGNVGSTTAVTNNTTAIAAINTSKGAASGIATLDSTTNIPVSQLGNVASVAAVSSATSDIATLQGQMTTANTDITTLQGTNLQQSTTLAATDTLLCTNGTQISKSPGTHTTVASIDADISSLTNSIGSINFSVGQITPTATGSFVVGAAGYPAVQSVGTNGTALIARIPRRRTA